MHEPVHDRTGVYTLRERGFCMENAVSDAILCGKDVRYG